MRHAHKLSHNKTTDLPQHFIVVDTETKPDERLLDQCIHRLTFGYAIYFTLPIGNKKKPKREVLRFEEAHAFWEWVESKLTSKIRVIISAHNMAFDFLVLNSLEELTRLGFAVDYPILGGTRFITRAKREGNSLWFIDTMNYIPTSLATLGKSLGLEKLTMPEDYDSCESWNTYCLRDTEILELFWRKLITFNREHDLGAFASTSASMAFNAFRHKHMHHEIFIHDQSDSLEQERESYFGGRCECFRIGKQEEQEYTLLDINSMYPFVMQALDYPTKLLYHSKAPPMSKFERYMMSAQCVATVGLETDEPMYPKRQEGKLIFPVGRFQTTLADPELREAMTRGQLRYIKSMIAYDHAPIFRTYVEEFYNLRLAYRSEGNEAFALFAKLLCNSLYGKFGQRGHEREDLPNLKQILFGHETLYSSKTGKLMNIYYWLGHGWIEHEEGEAFNSFPAISACVTSAARMHLWRLIERAQRMNVYYCDTDSLVVNRTGLHFLESDIDSRELGKLKVERASNTLTLLGAKDYTFGDKTKIKGVSSKALKLDDNLYEQIHFNTFRENMRAGVSNGVVLTNVQKRLRRVYDKGYVLPSGLVEPFRLTEF